MDAEDRRGRRAVRVGEDDAVIDICGQYLMFCAVHDDDEPPKQDKDGLGIRLGNKVCSRKQDSTMRLGPHKRKTSDSDKFLGCERSSRCHSYQA